MLVTDQAAMNKGTHNTGTSAETNSESPRSGATVENYVHAAADAWDRPISANTQHSTLNICRTQCTHTAPTERPHTMHTPSTHIAHTPDCRLLAAGLV